MVHAADKHLKISFCTTCMGRLHHLKETLPQNLINNADYPNTEFVILAYGDREVYDWVKDAYPEEIKTGRIKLAFTEQEYFRMAHAKNVAHRLGTGDVLVNLDADNVTGKDFAGWLNKEFSKNPDRVIRCTTKDKLRRKIAGKPIKSFDGRIAVHAQNFAKLHGYNERLNAWGGDDGDFEVRANASGLRTLPLPALQYGSILPHSNESRYTNMSNDDVEKSLSNLAKGGNNLLNRVETVKRLLNISTKEADNIEPANPDGDFGCGDVTFLKPDFSEEQRTLDPAPHPEWVASYDKSVERPRGGWSIG